MLSLLFPNFTNVKSSYQISFLFSKKNKINVLFDFNFYETEGKRIVYRFSNRQRVLLQYLSATYVYYLEIITIFISNLCYYLEILVYLLQMYINLSGPCSYSHYIYTYCLFVET